MASHTPPKPPEPSWRTRSNRRPEPFGDSTRVAGGRGFGTAAPRAGVGTGPGSAASGESTARSDELAGRLDELAGRLDGLAGRLGEPPAREDESPAGAGGE